MADYFVGLDIGTETVGWAVTDAGYRVLKKNGKALWGVRKFPETNSAKERRGFRTARRRLERRKQRIAWLRQVFSEEIARVDPAFFQRMDESKFLKEDKRPDSAGMPLGRFALFADRDYCDIDYHAEFPTVYHLRRALMTEERSFDVRLVYLAIHHILKKRGHFLFADMKLEDITLDGCLSEVQDCLREQYELDMDITDRAQFCGVMCDRALSASRKREELKKLTADTDPQLDAVIKLLAGAKGKASEVCGLALAKENDVEFSFKGSYDSEEPSLRELLGKDMRLIDRMKKLYDCALVEALRNGEGFLSHAKCSVHEKHKRDLDRLKALFRADSSLFREMFRAAAGTLNNYPAYSGHGGANHSCNYDEFCKYARAQIQALLPRLDERGKEEAERIRAEMEAGTYLPLQTDKENGTIPHQLHEQELRLILARAERYLPFLRERDGSGLTRSEQILAVFRFRIPYNVGPLDSRSEHSWIVRTGEKITPWNFEQVVDLAASKERFIERMTATCSYIGEPVLPKDSLLYSKCTVLNAINKIRVNDMPISVAVKQQIFAQHILVKRKVTARSIEDYMRASGLMEEGDTFDGLDEGFKAALTGWQVFRQILSRGNTESMVEDIIRHIVLYGEDRRQLELWLEQTYGEVLSAGDRGHILGNRSRFSGWGSLSGELLTKIEHIDGSTGEVITIADALWNTNHNLMELLSGRFTFARSIEAWREDKFSGKERTMDDVLEDSYASPRIRRPIHQAMSLISEIEKIMGGAPRRVFVETIRSEGEKKRTVSRKKQLEGLYALCRSDASDLYDDEVRKKLNSCDEAQLRSTKLYLYMTQMGKCMYSGKPIELSRMGEYDIDHIYPQSRVKDDSLDNRVLVRKELNQEKDDAYPVPERIRSSGEVRALWRWLRDKKLISAEKYRRLTRSTGFADEELSGFIARQLVETGQACKIVTQLLKNRYEGSDRVVYVKAEDVAAFRQDQRILPDGTRRQASACEGAGARQDPLFVKCREVNDLHHAKDAYLNIVVGNVYHVKFTRDPINFIRERRTYSLKRMFDHDVVRDGEWAWHRGEEGTIATVRRMMAKNNVLFTRYAYEAGGRLFKQQIVARGKGQVMIKGSDPRMTVAKYGGYDSRTGAYFLLVEHTRGKKRVRSIETVYLMDRALYERDPIGYCTGNLGLSDPRILIGKIRIDSLVEYDGFRMHVSGRSTSHIIYKNANQLIVSPEQAQYIKQIGKYCARADRGDKEITEHDGITARENEGIYRLLLDKLKTPRYRVKCETATKTIEENLEKFLTLSPGDQCRVLIQILNLFSTDAVKANLYLLCGQKGIGSLTTTKNISAFDKHSFKLIHQSVTGVFEQEIDLLGDPF